MKTNFNDDELEETEELQELSPEEAHSLGIKVEKTPTELLDEMEQAYANGGEMDEDEWIRLVREEKKNKPPEPVYTHEDIDEIYCLEELEKEDPEPDFFDREDFDGHLSEDEEKIYDEWYARRSNRRHDIFVREMIAHGNRRIAYQTAYPGVKDVTAKVNACKLMANPEIAQQIRDGIFARQKKEDEMVQAIYDGKLAAINEKREILAKLMRGQLLLEKEVSKNGTTETLKQKPDFKDILKAIVVDNKMEDQWLSNLSLPDNGY